VGIVIYTEILYAKFTHSEDYSLQQYNSSKRLSSITPILFIIYFCSSDAIILELLKYSVFYSRDIFIKLSLL